MTLSVIAERESLISLFLGRISFIFMLFVAGTQLLSTNLIATYPLHLLWRNSLLPATGNKYPFRGRPQWFCTLWMTFTQKNHTKKQNKKLLLHCIVRCIKCNVKVFYNTNVENAQCRTNTDASVHANVGLHQQNCLYATQFCGVTDNCTSHLRSPPCCFTQQPQYTTRHNLNNQLSTSSWEDCPCTPL